MLPHTTLQLGFLCSQEPKCLTVGEHCDYQAHKLQPALLLFLFCLFFLVWVLRSWSWAYYQDVVTAVPFLHPQRAPQLKHYGTITLSSSQILSHVQHPRFSVGGSDQQLCWGDGVLQDAGSSVCTRVPQCQEHASEELLHDCTPTGVYHGSH